MAKLDAILGRGDDAAPRTQGDKGSPAAAEANEGPDPRSDRAESEGCGTAYRIRTGDLRLERAVSLASRRMRPDVRRLSRDGREYTNELPTGSNGRCDIAPTDQTAPGRRRYRSDR